MPARGQKCRTPPTCDKRAAVATLAPRKDRAACSVAAEAFTKGIEGDLRDAPGRLGLRPFAGVREVVGSCVKPFRKKDSKVKPLLLSRELASGGPRWVVSSSPREER